VSASYLDYLARARLVAASLLGRRTSRGLLVPDRSPDSPDSFLGDQLAMLEALLDLHGLTTERSWREEAARLWRAVDENFTWRGGPLVADLAERRADAREAADAEARVGRLARTDAPPQENARLAVALDVLGAVQHDEGLRTRARDMLRALAPRIDDLRDFGAEYA
jgi:uncharacterized protein YyaL (SSP411 family)